MASVMDRVNCLRHAKEMELVLVLLLAVVAAAAAAGDDCGGQGERTM